MIAQQGIQPLSLSLTLLHLVFFSRGRYQDPFALKTPFPLLVLLPLYVPLRELDPERLLIRIEWNLMHLKIEVCKQRALLTLYLVSMKLLLVSLLIFPIYPMD